ncbi:MAG: membrane protein insertase YidC, partial [bacterium]|nr:membrane protein insertase YidC [bacterium]
MWSYYLKRNYQPVPQNNRIQFAGLKNIQYNKKSQALTLSWEKAISKYPVTYMVYSAENNKIALPNQPFATTSNTSYSINQFDPSQNYYFLVKAVDPYNYSDNNNHQIMFQALKNPQIAQEEIIKFENQNAVYYLSTLGGRIKNIELKKYANIHDSKPVTLIYEDKIKNKYFYPLDIKLLADKDLGTFPGNDTSLYSGAIYKDRIVFTSRNRSVNIIKEYIFPSDAYYFNLKITLQAVDKTDISFNRIVLKWQPVLGPVDKIDKYDILTVGYYQLEKLNQIKIKGKQLDQPVIKKDENMKWVTFYNRYFIAAMIPDESYRIKETVFYSDGNIYIGGISSEIDRNKLSAMEKIEYNYTIYAGPKLRDTFRKEKKLNSLESSILTQRLFVGKIVNKLGNFFLDVLILLNKLVHNFGLAVILFSIFIKIVLYPLTHKQLDSMAKMQKIQPIINQVKEQFKNDPKRLNVELMNVYKKYKVNPFGGCLPLILQIPIFFAIWDMLQYSLELRSADFLWIKSLALPDTVAHIMGVPINPLPILM